MLTLIVVQSGFIKNAGDVVKIGEKVNVKVLSFDATLGRVALTMKGLNSSGERHNRISAV